MEGVENCTNIDAASPFNVPSCLMMRHFITT